MPPSVVPNYEYLKQIVANSVLYLISNDNFLVVESDAICGICIIFLCSLTEYEKRQSSIEKEVFIIVEDFKKWGHYLIWKAFHTYNRPGSNFLYVQSKISKLDKK